MSVRDDLLAAIEAGDHMAVRRREWGEAWELLATANAPRQGCTLTELKPYVKLLGNEDPAAILEALEACAGEFRPTAGELRAHLNRRRGDGERVDVGRGRDRSSTPEATAAAAKAIHGGAHVCACGCPTSRTWRVDSAGVARCPDCDGIEPGQANRAEDAGLLEAAA